MGPWESLWHRRRQPSHSSSSSFAHPILTSDNSRDFPRQSGSDSGFRADSGIDVFITTDNNDLSGISVGSEVIFTDAFLVPAMENIYTSLKKNNLASTIQVTTSNAMNVLSFSYPTPSGAFDPTIATSVIVPLLEFLAQMIVATS
ncbi:unnamed protein product [Calypogeia fissa]